jgi:ABC-2 type transport system permease protein
MKSILKKELNSFFSTPIGYLVIAVYLLFNGLFLWVFKGDFNILHAGFADLNSYFFLAPWIFIFLIPAITMRSFSDEINSGTIEILATKPISNWQIIIGKYIGSLLLVLLAIIPTLIYVYSIYQLGNPIGNIEFGTTFGSFIGLFFLASAYVAIGIFSSTLSKNQIVSFIIAVIVSFLLYYGIEALANYSLFGNLDYTFRRLGMSEHYNSIGKGVIDTRDLIYFLTVTILFLFLTKLKIRPEFNYSKIAKFFIALFILNLISSAFHIRFDLTEDKRYTLSDATKSIVYDVDEVIHITVYLKGDFPSEFKRLQTETKQHLEELRALNKNIIFQFIDPLHIVQDLIDNGLEASRLQVQENGKLSELVIFPWAVITHKGNTENIALLKDIFSNSQNEQLESSIQNLEYAFTSAIHKLTSKKSKKIVVLKGNGELSNIYITDFLLKLREYYHLAPFTLDSVAVRPTKTFSDLSDFDLAIIAKPTEKFTEEEKFTLDQFIMNGGKTLWMIDNVQAELDSLMETGESLMYARDLGLTDFFFNYGVRINSDLITDLYSSQIPLATGNIGNQTQYNSFLWKYYPLLNSPDNHAINTNIEAVNVKFANTIDTLKNSIRKTVLLHSSPLSKPVGTPTIVSLKSIAQKPVPAEYNNGNKAIAVLLEGTFRSAYNGRVKPFKINNFKEIGVDNKMVIISDGDIIANEVLQGEPLELGVDKWSNQRFGNKEFLLNSVNYLLDDTGLVNIRSKKVKIDYLDKQKAFNQSNIWQLVNLFFPLLILGVFGFIFNYMRKKKYQ